MYRREYLLIAGTAGVVSVAGCTEDDAAAPSGETDGNSSDGDAVFEFTTESTYSRPFRTDEEIPIQTTVANRGDSAGEQTVEVRAEGELLHEQTVELAPEESTVLDFSEPATTFGTGTVEIRFSTDDDEQTITAEIETPTGSAVNVVSTVGRVNDSADGIELLSLTVQRSPGAPAVDLREFTVQYLDEDGTATYVHTSQDGANTFGVERIHGESSGPVLTADADRYQIHLPLTATYADGADYTEAGDSGAEPVSAADIETALSTGSEAELTLTAASGRTTTEELVVPATLSGKELVTL